MTTRDVDHGPHPQCPRHVVTGTSTFASALFPFSRFLQRQFEEGTAEDIEKVYREIKDHIVELMTDPFGNYLVQKLLEVCTPSQQMEILSTATARENELITISLNMHGYAKGKMQASMHRLHDTISLNMHGYTKGKMQASMQP